VSGWPRVEKTGVFGAGGGFIDWSNEVRSDAVWCPSNDRPFRDQPVSRRALFDELERTALQPLPSRPFELADWKSGKVNIDYHVEFDTRYYSVPHQLVHEPVVVRATAQIVELIHRNRLVTSH